MMLPLTENNMLIKKMALFPVKENIKPPAYIPILPAPSLAGPSTSTPRETIRRPPNMYILFTGMAEGGRR
jgi:hypothetical protein